MSDRACDVCVVGAGIAGLSAAYELQRRGLRAIVLEASPRAGGVILTEHFDGWTIDGGPDSMLVQKPAAEALCSELGIAERLVSTLEPRTAFVLRRDRLHPLAEGSFLGFPIRLSALARSTLFTIGGKLRMACEMVVPRVHGEADESIASFVRRRFGQEAVDYLAEPLLAGIHAGDVDRLSMQALFPRLLEAERRAGGVLRSLRARQVPQSRRGAFVSLPGGTGELVDALCSALAPGSLTLSAGATELHRTRGYVIESAAGPVRATSVMLAVPAYVAARLLRSLDVTLASLCDAIPYASTATVSLGYRRSQVTHPLSGTGFVVPRVERGPLLASTWVSSKWPGRAPPGHVLLRAFLGGGRDPHRLDDSDEKLIRAAEASLAKTLGISGLPVVTRLYRWTRQSPQYEVGHQDRVAAILRRVAAFPGLFVAGSGFRAIGIPDCIADGREAASRAASYVTGTR